ncbi:hypothetical protein IGL98_000794 [Enterococcus sp. DIV0840]
MKNYITVNLLKMATTINKYEGKTPIKCVFPFFNRDEQDFLTTEFIPICYTKDSRRGEQHDKRVFYCSKCRCIW